MAIELPFVVSAVPNEMAITSIGAPGIGLRMSGASAVQSDANGPHVVLTTQPLIGCGVTVGTTVGFLPTIMAPDLSFRITTGGDITSLILWVGAFRDAPGEPEFIATEMAAFRYATATDGTAFWRTVTCDSAGVTETTVTTAAIAASTEYVLRIAMAAASITFYVNGTSVATHATNIPTSTTLLAAGLHLIPLADSSRSVSFGYFRVGQVDHGQTAGLTDDDHSQYALLAGRASSQSLSGGTAASETLTLASTAHATKGGVRIGASDWIRVPEIAAPATPATGNVNVYAKADGLVYGMDDAGVETALSNAAGGGTVTSVGLSLPAIMTVSGSPVTTSGTLTGTLATQTANTVWAGPTSGGAAAPTFRALTFADMGTTRVIKVKSADEAVTSSAVLQDDDHLLFAVGTSEAWIFEAILWVTGVTAGDIQIAMSYPAPGTTMRWSGVGPSASSGWDTTAPEVLAAADMEVAQTGSGTLNYGVNGTTNGVSIMIHGYVATTITSGNVVIQWAQRVSNATATTVLAYSWLRAERVS